MDDGYISAGFINDPAPQSSETSRPRSAVGDAQRETAPTQTSSESDGYISAGFINFGTAAQPQTQAPSRARGEKSLAGDIGTLFYSSMLDTLATGAAAGEYMAGSGGTLTAWRESLSQAAREAQKGVSQEMQSALSRRFIPSEDDAPSAYKSFGGFFGAVGAQAVASLGSIVASVPAIGVGVLGGGPVGGMVAGGATAGLLGMGAVWKDTAEAFQQIPEAERRRLNAGYASRRDAGMDPAQAIDETVREAAGRYPEIAGILSAVPGAVMGRFEAALGARQLSGGITRNALRGGGREALTEAPEEITQNVATQLGTERLTGEPFRVSEAAEAGVRGAIGGAGMGAAMGAVGGAFGRAPEELPAPPPPPTPTQQGLDPSITAAAQTQTQAPLSPIAQAATTTTMSPIPDPLGVGNLALPSAPQAAPTTQETQDTAGVDAALAAALQQSAPTQSPLSPVAQAAGEPPTPATMSPIPDPLGVGNLELPAAPVTPEAPPETPVGAVEQLTQSPIEMLRAEGITLDDAETKRFAEFDSEMEAYRKFLDCVRGLK